MSTIKLNIHPQYFPGHYNNGNNLAGLAAKEAAGFPSTEQLPKFFSTFKAIKTLIRDGPRSHD